jgi:DNA topoisomerase-1
LQLPRHIGQSVEDKKIITNMGRFGPYIKYGTNYVSLKGDDDPYTVGLERALVLIKEKEEYEASRIIKTFKTGNIQILKGRRANWRPYVTNGEVNATVKKDINPAKLTLKECQEMLKNAPARKKTTTRKTAAKKKAPAKKKTTARKTTATKRKTTRKPAAKKTTAIKRKTTRKTPAKKTTTRKAPVKRATVASKKKAS